MSHRRGGGAGVVQVGVHAGRRAGPAVLNVNGSTLAVANRFDTAIKCSRMVVSYFAWRYGRGSGHARRPPPDTSGVGAEIFVFVRDVRFSKTARA